VSWLRIILPSRLRFDLGLIHVIRFVVEKMALGQAFLRALRFSAVIIIPFIHCSIVIFMYILLVSGRQSLPKIYAVCRNRGALDKVNFTLEQAMKAQRGSRGIALLFL
jgi:hypothetical protein